MNLDPNGTTAGVPNKKLRDFFRKHGRYGRMTDGDIVEFLDSYDRFEFMEALVEEGLVARDGDRGDASRELDPAYSLTFEGRRFAVASFLKPIPKVKADILFADFMTRVNEVNADEKFPLTVKAAHVYGSYTREQEFYGDIDLMVESDWRGGTYEASNKLRDKLIEELDLNLDFYGRMYYPEKALRMRLQNRRPHLSILIGAPMLDTFYKKVFG